jgi:hypothetical protein
VQPVEAGQQLDVSIEFGDIRDVMTWSVVAEQIEPSA